MWWFQGAGHFVHIFITTWWNPTLCQNLVVFHQNIDGNMKFRSSLIIISHQIVQKNFKFASKMRLKGEFLWTFLDNYGQIFLSIFSLLSLHWSLPNSPFHLTLYQKVMFFHQAISGNMRFRYSLIIIDQQMEQRILKNVNNCLNTNIYSYLETSGGKS